MWGLPRSGPSSLSPALAGRFFTTEPPGKSPQFVSLLSLVNTTVLHDRSWLDVRMWNHEYGGPVDTEGPCIQRASCKWYVAYWWWVLIPPSPRVVQGWPSFYPETIVFPKKSELREFIITKPTLQEMLTGILQTERMVTSNMKTYSTPVKISI